MIKKLLRHIFSKMWGFEDVKHIQDFIAWDNHYRAQRALKRKRGMAND